MDDVTATSPYPTTTVELNSDECVKSEIELRNVAIYEKNLNIKWNCFLPHCVYLLLYSGLYCVQLETYKTFSHKDIF